MATRDAVSDLIRGNIDAIILNDSYGYEILKDIATASQGEYEMKEPLALSAPGCGELLGQRDAGSSAQVLSHHRCGHKVG